MATPAPPGAQKKADLQTGNSVPPLIDESDPNVLYVMQPGHVIPPQSAPTNKADIDNRPGSSAECSLTCCPMTLERVTRTCGSARVTPTYVEWDVVDVRGSRSIGTGTYGTVTRSDVHWLHPTDVANGLFAIKEYICREEYNDIPLDGNAIREVTMARNVRFPATGACKAALHPKTGVFRFCPTRTIFINAIGRMFMNCAQDTLLAAAASGGIDNIGRFPPAALTRERVAVIEDLAFQAILSVAYLHVKVYSILFLSLLTGRIKGHRALRRQAGQLFAAQCVSDAQEMPAGRASRVRNGRDRNGDGDRFRNIGDLHDSSAPPASGVLHDLVPTAGIFFRFYRRVGRRYSCFFPSLVMTFF